MGSALRTAQINLKSYDKRKDKSVHSTERRKNLGPTANQMKYATNIVSTSRQNKAIAGAYGSASYRSRDGSASNSREPRLGYVSNTRKGAKVKQMIGYQQNTTGQKAKQQNFDHLAKNKLLKTVNIDLDAMIKESDKEYRATDNSEANNPFDESVTMTMDELLPEPPSEMPSEYMNVRMSVPSAQGVIQDFSHSKQSEA